MLDLAQRPIRARSCQRINGRGVDNREGEIMDFEKYIKTEAGKSALNQILNTGVGERKAKAWLRYQIKISQAHKEYIEEIKEYE